MEKSIYEKIKLVTLIRTVVITLFLIGQQFLITTEGIKVSLSLHILQNASIFIYIYSLVTLVVLYFLRKYLQIILYFYIFIECVFISFYMLYTGFSSSFFSGFFILLIFFSAQVLPTSGIFVTGAYAILSYVVVALIEMGYIGNFANPISPRNEIYSNFLINVISISVVTALSYYYKRHVISFKTVRESFKLIKNIHEHIVKSIPVGLIVVDQEFTITVVNRIVKSMFNTTDDSYFIGKKIDEFFPSLKPIIKNKDKLLRFINNETLIDVIKNKKYTLQWNISVFENEDHGIIGYIFIFRDITELVKLEKKAKKNEQLAIIGKLAAGIVHEIRNPLASISGAIEMLLDNEKFSEHEKKLIEIIHREVKGLTRWTEDFLNYAKPKKLDIEEINISKLLGEVIEIMKNEIADDNIKITFKDDGKKYKISGDRGLLFQVARNIIKNSIEAIKEDSYYKNKKEGSIEIEVSGKEDGTVLIKFKDSGPGFNPETIDKVFEPFFTTKEGGTGLGLPIVQRIIEIHNGSISVYNGYPKGAIVEISLPALK